jgi:hypothetical protein
LIPDHYIIQKAEKRNEYDADKEIGGYSLIEELLGLFLKPALIIFHN